MASLHDFRPRPAAPPHPKCAKCGDTGLEANGQSVKRATWRDIPREFRPCECPRGGEMRRLFEAEGWR